MTLHVTTRGPGLDFEEVDAVCRARGRSVTKGQLCAVALIDSSVITADSLTVTIEPGVETATSASVFSTVTSAYTSTATRVGLFGVALQDIADGDKGRIRFRGMVPYAVVENANNSDITKGQFLVAGDGGTVGTIGKLNASLGQAVGGSTQSTDAWTRKMIGMAMETYYTSTSDTSAGTTMQVLFDGINGFGGLNSA